MLNSLFILGLNSFFWNSSISWELWATTGKIAYIKIAWEHTLFRYKRFRYKLWTMLAPIWCKIIPKPDFNWRVYNNCWFRKNMFYMVMPFAIKNWKRTLLSWWKYWTSPKLSIFTYNSHIHLKKLTFTSILFRYIRFPLFCFSIYEI